MQKAVRVSVGSCLWGAGNGAGLRGKEAKLLCCPGKVLEGSVKILEPGHMFRIVPLRRMGGGPTRRETLAGEVTGARGLSYRVSP